MPCSTSTSSSTLMETLPVAHTSLLPQRRTLLVPTKPVEFTLDPLESTAWSTGELSVEALTHFFPFQAQVDAVVPDKVHLFFFVSGAYGALTVCCVYICVGTGAIAVALAVAMAWDGWGCAGAFALMAVDVEGVC